MALCSASVTARSNSDMLTIGMIAADTSIPSDVRMEMIARVASGWDAATQGSTGRYGAVRQADRRVERQLWPYAR